MNFTALIKHLHTEQYKIYSKERTILLKDNKLKDNYKCYGRVNCEDDSDEIHCLFANEMRMMRSFPACDDFRVISGHLRSFPESSVFCSELFAVNHPGPACNDTNIFKRFCQKDHLTECVCVHLCVCVCVHSHVQGFTQWPQFVRSDELGVNGMIIHILTNR